jgi:hypothetical protein
MWVGCMKENIWGIVAWFLSRTWIANYLIKRAQRTPYFHLEGYMERFWLFNGYGKSDPEGGRFAPPRWPWLPSIRVHHILRPDAGTAMHDHPWDARTIILKGAYREHWMRLDLFGEPDWDGNCVWQRGETKRLRFETDFHRIEKVSKGGVWTLFFTWNYKGTWGFWNSATQAKVPYKEWLSL